jgi:glycosyltransferase involved in cell wall biosynthesis
MARVASVAFTYYDSDPRVRRMAEALVERGDTVTAVVLRGDRPARRVVAGVEIVGIPIPRYRGTSNLAYAAQYAAFFAAAIGVVSALHVRRRFDVVHVNNMPDFMIFAAAPAKAMGSKLILDLHDPMPELYASKFARGSRHPAVRFIAAMERASVAYADRAITVNELMRDTFVGHGNPEDAFTIVQNVADTRYFPMGAALDKEPRRDGIRVVYHGTFAPRLGLDVALHAMRRVADARSDVTLTMIGDGNDASRLSRLIDELDLRSHVDLRIGFVPVDELLPILIASDVGIVPAQAGPFTNTMVPSKLLEYVTLGIATICSDLPAVRRYFDPDQVAFVPPGDPAALSDAIITLAEDPSGRRRQAEQALTFLDQNNWDGERQRYFDLIDELAAS